ncbi:hypothetical protein T45_07610 [Streptomyces turgidiscabies]|nr:hypothetical protein T45_07610 [Streptomyces turgidiscabies]
MGDGLDRMVEAVAAALAAVTQDLAVLHPGDGMLDAGTDPTVLGVVFLLTRGEWPAGPFSVRGDQACVDVGAVAQHRDAVAVLGKTGVPPDLGIGPVARARQAAGTTSLVPALMMTCTFAENR